MADIVDEATENATFEDLRLDSWLIKQLKVMKLRRPTPVQYNCIPPILDGRDCIGCAKTGSGKTMAFVLPILQALSVDPYGIFALILTPTRELAVQIADQFRVLGKHINLRDCVVIGGLDMVAQGLELSQKPHIVIATPGRLADHLKSCDTFTLSRVRFLVIDEADRLVGGAFDDQMKTILAALPSKRQTLLFSATITDALTKLKSIGTTQPYFWESRPDIVTVAQLDQYYCLAPVDFKDSYLVQIVHQFVKNKPDRSVMIFTDTCKGCQILNMMFRQLGFECGCIHSMIPQKERLMSLEIFKSSKAKILIATDVASRGLDIPTVDLIINHNVPLVPKDYVHRVGRTARAGRGGRAITFVTQHDIRLIHAIEELIGKKLSEYTACEKDVLTILTQVAVAKRECEIRLDATNFDEKRENIKKRRLILEGKDPEEEERKKLRRIKEKRKKFKQERFKKSVRQHPSTEQE
ncbi:Putative ATP-dependent RNA helicase ddx49 [Chamberlinius hualienensis]